MRRYSLFIVDDDSFYIQSVKMALPSEWSLTDSWQKADAALIDIHLKNNLEDFSGLNEMSKLRTKRSSLQIIATSGDLNRSTMEKALMAGCDLFLAKPFKPAQLLNILNKVATLQQLREVPTSPGSSQLAWIGESSASQKVKAQIAQLAGEDGPILIEGETGTGKEVVAHLLHKANPSRPLVKVNVAAIASTLFESEMYGHVRGSFTGATYDKIGLIEAADGGDLFLDEIETLDKAHQASLLRFLECGEIKPVGGNQSKGVSVRILAASNQKLKKLVENSKFREDLYWRLAKHQIALPALRDRSEDIGSLANWFLSSAGDNRKELTADGLSALERRSWPGNVRELRRACEQLSLKAPLPIIRKEDVDVFLAESSSQPVLRSAEGHLEDLIADFEKQVIISRLQTLKDVDDTAKSLNISRSTLYKKMKDLDIQLGETT